MFPLMRRTRVVATIGPSTESQEKLEELFVAGVDVARLNFAHATHQWHRRVYDNIRLVSRGLDKPVAVLQDLSGPKVRVGELSQAFVHLDDDQRVTLTARDVKGTSSVIPVSLPEVFEGLQEGHRVYMADGLIELEVESAGNQEATCRVIRGGDLAPHKGVNIPGAPLNVPSLTEKDRRDVRLGVELGVDFIALSFVRDANELLELGRVLDDLGASTPVIAKVEKREALDNIDEIIDLAYGVMIARGDLGVDIPAENVPLAQKMVIEKCNRRGKPVITATQMLESMVDHPRPTRAEASDAANAVLDGTDAVMLSDETSVGEYPVEAVKTLCRIANTTEEARGPRARGRTRPREGVTDAIAYSAYQAARGLEATAIFTATQSGYTAREVSKYRPEAPILAITRDTVVTRQLMLSWGVHPIQVEPASVDEMIENAVEEAVDRGLVSRGDLVVVTAGMFTGAPGSTNMLRVHVIGKSLTRGVGSGKGVIRGPIHRVYSVEDARETTDGDIVLLEIEDPDVGPHIRGAGAILTSQRGLTGYPVILARELGLPVIAGVDPSVLEEGQGVTLDVLRGVVYEGDVRLPHVGLG